MSDAEEPLLPKWDGTLRYYCTQVYDDVIGFTKRRKGMVASLASAFFLSLTFLFAQLAGLDGSVNTFEIFIFRQTFLTFYTLPVVSYREKPYHVSGLKRWLTLCLRMFTGAGNHLLMYVAVTKLPLKDAVVLSSVSPVFCAFLSRCFLGESLNFIEILLSIIILGGVALDSKPTWLFSTDHNFDVDTVTRLVGTAFALGSAISSALSTMLNRQMRDVDWATIECVYNYQSMLIGWPILLVSGYLEVPPCSISLYLILLGLVSVPCQSFYVYACQNERAGIVQAGRTSATVFALIWEITVYRSFPDIYSAVGCLVILGCLLAMAIYRDRRQSAEDKESIMESPSQETELQ